MGAAKDCVASGENGIIFEEGVVSDLAEGLRRLVVDPALADAMGAQGRESARARTPEWAAQQLEAAVASALANSAASLSK